jgi:hypothetical protein
MRYLIESFVGSIIRIAKSCRSWVLGQRFEVEFVRGQLRWRRETETLAVAAELLDCNGHELIQLFAYLREFSGDMGARGELWDLYLSILGA